ncbi:unnamed protein product [Arctogadus glacialis]
MLIYSSGFEESDSLSASGREGEETGAAGRGWTELDLFSTGNLKSLERLLPASHSSPPHSRSAALGYKPDRCIGEIRVTSTVLR